MNPAKSGVYRVSVIVLALTIFLPLLAPTGLWAFEEEGPYDHTFPNLRYYSLRTSLDPNDTPDMPSSVEEPGPDESSSARSGKRFSSILDFGALHKYLGYSAVAAAAGSLITGGVSPKNEIHPGFSYAAMGLGAGAILTGLIEYRDVLWTEEGLSESRAHALSGALATAGFVAALALAADDSHKAVGGASGAAFILTLAILYF